MEIDEAGLSLTVPEGWRPVPTDGTSGMVAAFTPVEAGDVPLQECARVVLLSVEPGVRDLGAWAILAMARNVGREGAELLAVEIAGVPAVMASWTDGISDVASWFAVCDGRGVRFDAYSLVDFARTTTSSGDVGELGDRFVRTVTWGPARST